MSRASHIEIELKYRLDRWGHEKLRRAFSGRWKRLRTVSYYFDTPKLYLKKNRIGLRIRIIDGRRAMLTAKFPMAPTNGGPRALKIRREYEVPIPLSRAKSLIRGTRHFLAETSLPIVKLKSQIPIQEMALLTTLGRMNMSRAKASVEGLPLELDRWQVFGRNYYELEVETRNADRAHREVQDLLKSLGIPCRPEGTSKLARFLKEWRKRQ